MRTTIRMNEELGRRVKQYAARHDRTFTEVIEEAVMLLLANGKPAEQNPIFLPTVGDPHNRVTEAQYRRAIEEMYDEEAMRMIRGCRDSDRR